ARPPPRPWHVLHRVRSRSRGQRGHRLPVGPDENRQLQCAVLRPGRREGELRLQPPGALVRSTWRSGSHRGRCGARQRSLGQRGPMNYETLLYEQDGQVVTLTYNRPDQHNAVNRAMNAELHHAWERFRDDDDAFVLVITGAGQTTFCAGWDLQDAAELSELGDYDAFRVSLYNSPGECGYTRKVDIFKPVIAAVNGYAFAAGLETALLADIRIAAENAEFGALERRWNIVGGDGMTVRLPLVVGFAKAMELIITGRR